jgi:uncharacterized Zn-finger protein
MDYTNFLVTLLPSCCCYSLRFGVEIGNLLLYLFPMLNTGENHEQLFTYVSRRAIMYSTPCSKFTQSNS